MSEGFSKGVQTIRSVAPDQLSFYEVPLACPAARGLGCGSLAKPVLLALEGKNVVEEAWLDRSGNTLALVWMKGISAEARRVKIKPILTKHRMSVNELSGKKRNERLKSFLAGADWYRGAGVDRLSEEEAVVIARRWIKRAFDRIPTPAIKSRPLKLALTDVIRERLVSCPGQSAECFAAFYKKVAIVAQPYLRRNELNALVAAAKLGARPVDRER